MPNRQAVAQPRLRPLRSITRFANPLMKPLARWAPGLGVVSYVGRKSGRRYSTPAIAIRRGDTYWFSLAYGADSQWVKNVLATREARVTQRRTTRELREPQVVADPKAHAMPLLFRPFMRAMRIREFLTMQIRGPVAAR